jgi:hypothetical protein
LGKLWSGALSLRMENVGLFYGHLAYITTIWYSLCQFGILGDIWYILIPFWYSLIPFWYIVSRKI